MTNANTDTPLTLLQWNIHGLKSKLPILHLVLAEHRYDVMQETLLKSNITITNYRSTHLYHTPGGSRGFSILVRKDLHTELLSLFRSCGTKVEVLGITVSLHNTKLHIYNIYRPPTDSSPLKLDHLFASISTATSIICGDFSAHDPTWNDPASPSAHRSCRAGKYLNRLLQDFPHVFLLNRHTPTRLRGGILDLTFIFDGLLPRAMWALYPYLTSDHFASITSLALPRVQTSCPEPRWNYKKADWPKFTSFMELWAEYHPTDGIDSQEEEFVAALHQAANASIPITGPHPTCHKNSWYYNDRVHELKHRLSSLRKILQRHPSPTILATFRAAQQLIKKELHDIRSISWLKWCEFLNAHSSLHDIWRQLNKAAGKYNRQPCHPQPV